LDGVFSYASRARMTYPRPVVRLSCQLKTRAYTPLPLQPIRFYSCLVRSIQTSPKITIYCYLIIITRVEAYSTLQFIFTQWRSVYSSYQSSSP